MRCAVRARVLFVLALFTCMPQVAVASEELLDCFEDGGPVGLAFMIHRRAEGDSLRLLVNASAGGSATGHASWEVTLGEGLQAVEGATSGDGSPTNVSGRHLIEVRCDRWGDFTMIGRVRTAADSLNSGMLVVEWRFRATPESLIVQSTGRTLEHEWVRNGVHHGLVGSFWLPLDTGEAAASSSAQGVVKRPKPLHSVSGRSGSVGALVTAIDVRVIVAVDRAGRVKAARYMGMLPKDPAPQVVEAALAAARQWTFSPAVSQGQPVSALYEIWVPVTAP